MAVVDRETARAAAILIRDETGTALNTASRVGSLLLDLADSLQFVTVMRETVETIALTNVASLSGAQTVNGVALVDGDRVLLTAQSTGTENAQWIVRAGAWERPTGVTTLPPGALFHVKAGTESGDTWWFLTNDTTVTLDTDTPTFQELDTGGALVDVASPGQVNTLGGADTVLTSDGATAGGVWAKATLAALAQSSATDGQLVKWNNGASAWEAANFGLSEVLADANATGANDIDVTGGQAVNFLGEIDIQRGAATVLSTSSGLLATSFPFVATSITGSATRGILAQQVNGAADAARLGFSKARGSLGLEEAVQLNDFLGSAYFTGHDGTGFVEAASIEVQAVATPSANVVPVKMSFKVMDAAGALQELLKLEENTVTVGDVSTVKPIITSSANVLLGVADLVFSKSIGGCEIGIEARTGTNESGNNLDLFAQTATGTGDGGNTNARGGPGGASGNNGDFIVQDADGNDLARFGDSGGSDSIAFLANVNVGLFGATPVAQQTAPGVLTDSTGGTTDGTLSAISGSGDDANINNNFAELAEDVTALRTALINLGAIA